MLPYAGGSFLIILLGVITRRSVYFTAPRSIEIREETLSEPGPGDAVVQTMLSAISPGTEHLVYQGLFPGELAIDENIASLRGHFDYPLKYGYSAVGQVIALGPAVEPAWLGRTVFAFNPHESHFIAPVTSLIPLPEDMSPETAVFLPNMETAVNFILDGKPLIGERGVVLGQGIVGLLTTALLAQFPLERLVTLDRYALRRQASLELGAHASLDPDDTGAQDQLHLLLPEGADLCYELTGSPTALDQAIAITGFDGRVLIGSWYGQKRLSLDLGGRFHRSRIRLISTQVSTLAPELTGRWSKRRRFEVAWEMLPRVGPARWITHRFALQEAAQAYQWIEQHPDQSIQVVLTYP
ncbi:MAG: oxidoreductase [Chloroflexi bacterium RBG_16_57_11]|nr:MAG: oxidoreductase [Chloroflexi bacterium RBG_16_57_11]